MARTNDDPTSPPPTATRRPVPSSAPRAGVMPSGSSSSSSSAPPPPPPPSSSSSSTANNPPPAAAAYGSMLAPSAMLSQRWWQLSGAEVSALLRTSLETGLSQGEAEARRKLFGGNELPATKVQPFWKLVLKQFKDFLVIILLCAALVSFVLAIFEEEEHRTTAFVEPFVILAILIVNAAVGVVQETNAEKAIHALRSYEAAKAVVLRDGRVSQVKAVDLVPGDVIEVSAGGKVPADARVVVIHGSILRVDQSLLTGESETVNKDVNVVRKDSPVDQEKTNMVFSGTLATRGKAIAVVTGTGLGTSLGRILASLDDSEKEDEKSPMKEKLDEFGEYLSKMIFVACALVWLINIRHFSDEERGGTVRGAIYYFKIAVALAVAAVPEGLPAVVTTCLALGAREMAKEGAIVRSLPAVETLGCTTIICSDKTGTMTTNQMAVQKLLVVTAGMPSPHVLEFDVEGSDYTPRGRVVSVNSHDKGGGGGGGARGSFAPHPSLSDLARIAALCNEAKLDYDPITRKFGYIGEPTEAALKVLAEKIGLPSDNTAMPGSSSSTLQGGERDDPVTLSQRGQPPDVVLRAATRCSQHWEKEHPVEYVLEFTRSRKSMSVLCKSKGGATRALFCKGAPSSVLARCDRVRLDSGGTAPLDEALRNQILQHVSRLGGDSFRCLALAQGEVSASLQASQLQVVLSDTDKYADLERKMTLVGIVGMIDPPRPQVRPALLKCRRAGIRVIMITGDDSATAEAVARSVDLLPPETLGLGKDALRRQGVSLSGEEWSLLNPAQKREAASKLVILHRVEPQHKFALVDYLRNETGDVVAMTGDGVNDAPALRCADIGVAMGSGTAVAREAADMVLADDNFATIVSAVRQGRAIFANTKQFIRYLVSSNLGEVACIFLAAALGVPEALLPVQLLWVNLVTDGLPATALGFNPPDPEVMHRPPRDRREPLVSRWMAFRYFVIGMYVGVAVVWSFIWWFTSYAQGPRMTFRELRSFATCPQSVPQFENGFDCGVFHRGRADGLDRASTVALSVLVLIEMFNAFNALSETESLLTVVPWTNRYLLMAVALSMALHFSILYLPPLSAIFGVSPLKSGEWFGVVLFSFPVVLIDEFIKLVTRATRLGGVASGRAGVVGASAAGLLSPVVLPGDDHDDVGAKMV